LKGRTAVNELFLETDRQESVVARGC